MEVNTTNFVQKLITIKLYRSWSEPEHPLGTAPEPEHFVILVGSETLLTTNQNENKQN